MSLNLITKTFVKEKFPQWADYCQTDAGVDETIIDDEIELSENKLLEYINVDSESITEPLKLHLFNIVRYRLFNRKHGDTEFDNKPRIVKDYEETIETLKNIRDRKIPVSAPSINNKDAIKVTAKTKMFGTAGGFLSTDDENS